MRNWLILLMLCTLLLPQHTVARKRFSLRGVVQHSATHQPLAHAVIRMTRVTDQFAIQTTSDLNGQYHFRAEAGHTYRITVYCTDYFDAPAETLYADPGTCYTHHYLLTPVDPNLYITLPGIYYDLERSMRVWQTSRSILDSLALAWQKQPNLKIELGSHTDCRADSVYNRRLSQARADSAVAYLIANGISANRIVAHGYGEHLLTNACACEGAVSGKHCTEEEHEHNRRTTIRYLGNPLPEAAEGPLTQKKKALK